MPRDTRHLAPGEAFAASDPAGEDALAGEGGEGFIHCPAGANGRVNRDAIVPVVALLLAADGRCLRPVVGER
jgi:hypothetical protein